MVKITLYFKLLADFLQILVPEFELWWRLGIEIRHEIVDVRHDRVSAFSHAVHAQHCLVNVPDM